MSIQMNPAKTLFTLHTAHTSYQMWADERGILHHLYYGPAIGDDDLRPTEFYSDCGFSPNPAGVDVRDYSLDTMSQEYTGCGVGDFRISCLSVSNTDGSPTADLRFAGAKLLPGKYALPGLPASFDNGGECQTLQLTLKDALTGLTVTLLYGVYEEADVITRAALIENGGKGAMQLHKAASACLDLPFGEWELIHFHGRHCMERQPERAPLLSAVQTLRSARGASSHHHNPFAILAAPHTTEDAGDCLGAMLVYSGNFKIECERSQLHSTRLVAGISDDDFTLDAGPRRELCHAGGALHLLQRGPGRACPASITGFLQHNMIRSSWKDRPPPHPHQQLGSHLHSDFDGERIVCHRQAGPGAGRRS